jgi:putative transposase
MNVHTKHDHLPRLAPEYYQGLAVVHWVMTIDDRQSGWLTPQFHAQCREALLHTLVRYQLVSSAYCLMPDHAHFVWMGVSPASDLAFAADFFRRQTNQMLAPFRWQKEPFDHVLREHEGKRGAFSAVCHYVFENPVRKGIVERWAEYSFLGAMLPGYPDVDPRREDFWDVFWKIYAKQVAGNCEPTRANEPAP